MTQPYVHNIEDQTMDNDNFRKVVFTGKHLQMVVMVLKPGEEIGTETHDKSDQFIRLEKGEGKAVIDRKEYSIKTDFAVIIPAGTEHNIINTGHIDMKLYTVYSSQEHPDGIVEHTKKDAEEMESE